MNKYVWGGIPPRTELSSGGRAPCSTGFPCKVSVLGTHLYQCTSWCCCERLHLASVNFFEDSFSVFAHFIMTDLRAHLTTPHWVFNSFWLQTAWPLYPTLPIHLILPQMSFCLFVYFPGWKTSSHPQRETFCWCGKCETKNSRSSKRHQNQQAQKRFWAVKKHFESVLHQMESTLKVVEVYTCKNKYTIFYK